jgi:hypothetical protein
MMERKIDPEPSQLGSNLFPTKFWMAGLSWSVFRANEWRLTRSDSIRAFIEIAVRMERDGCSFSLSSEREATESHPDGPSMKVT